MINKVRMGSSASIPNVAPGRLATPASIEATAWKVQSARERPLCAGLREHFQEGGPRAVHHALARTPGQGSGHRANGIIGRSDKHQVTGRDDLLAVA